MAKWITYKIIGKEHKENYIRFNLDNKVSFSGTEGNYINLVNHLPFSEWEENDKIMIDIDKTKGESNDKIFTFYSNVALQSSSHWKDKYKEVQGELSELKAWRDIFGTGWDKPEKVKEWWNKTLHYFNENFLDLKDKGVSDDFLGIVKKEINDLKAENTDLKKKKTNYRRLLPKEIRLSKN